VPITRDSMDVRRTQTVPGIKTASSYSTAACLHVRAAVPPPNRPRTLRPAPCTTLKSHTFRPQHAAHVLVVRDSVCTEAAWPDLSHQHMHGKAPSPCRQSSTRPGISPSGKSKLCFRKASIQFRTPKASRRPHSETLPEPRTHESPPAKALLSAAQTGSMNTREPAAHESPPAKALLSAILFALLCSRVSSLRLLLVRHFHWGRQHSPAFACATLPMGAPPPPYAVVQSLSCSQ